MSIEQLLGNPAPGWVGRVKPGAYTSPLGVRVPFQFVDLTQTVTKRTKAFEFNGLDDAYIQDNGHSAREYPLRCLFTGNDHDLIAASFMAGLLERGPGQLEHPLYGTFRAIPVGTISRRNDLVQEANQSVVEVNFSTTLANIYPSGEGFPVSEILASIDGFNLQAALQFDALADLESAIHQANMKSLVRSAMAGTRAAFDKISGITSDARAELADRQALINEGIDTFVGTPLLLAQQILGFVAAPARSLSGFASRLEGYALMIENMATVYGPIGGVSPIESYAIGAKNQFALVDLMMLGAATSVALSTTTKSAKFVSRASASEAALSTLEQLGAVVSWRDESLTDLGVVDTGESYQAAQDAAAKAAGYLVQSSFSLVPERRIVLDRDRTLLDMCAELYGSVSNETLDLFIDSNDLSGDEIIEIPRGRSVVYYA